MLPIPGDTCCKFTLNFSYFSEEDYLTPKDVNDFYKPCPPPKPYHPPSPLSSNLEPPQEGGYMTMNNIPSKLAIFMKYIPLKALTKVIS